MDESSDREKWNLRYAGEALVLPQPAYVLVAYQHLLPIKGVALDLACGLGGNALFLAAKGLQTHAWDVSSAAIEKLSGVAKYKGLRIQGEVRDVVRQPPPSNSYDVIVVSRFLQRSLIHDIILALKAGGVVFYQTFIKDKPADIGPNNPAYLLAENELLQLFSPLRILVYREEGQIGDVTQGLRYEAMLVGQKKV
ncbi:MAG: methyltransferase type 12 [Gammaproteobacteria bacterium SG8_11]|nr:MAG: methyltransferase type 12 [Gammaproteobacteria bacterium SG8_11]